MPSWVPRAFERAFAVFPLWSACCAAFRSFFPDLVVAHNVVNRAILADLMGLDLRLAPTPVKEPRLIKVNAPLAIHLGLDPDWLESSDGIRMLAGNLVPEGAAPLAMAYRGLGDLHKAEPHLRQWRNTDILLPDPLQQELDRVSPCLANGTRMLSSSATGYSPGRPGASRRRPARGNRSQ